MSFPKIPDIDPVIDLTLCDAVHLLLTSIALEEVSLSQLMETEREKLRYALDLCRRQGAPLCQLLAVNQSADHMLGTLTKLQFLLTGKLEEVKSLAPCCTVSGTTTCTTTTCTTTSASCTCSTAAPDGCRGCCLMGVGRGCIAPSPDPFGGCPVWLYAFLPCGQRERAVLRCRVGDSKRGFSLYAAGRDLSLVCPRCPQEPLSLTGVGRKRSLSGGAEAGERVSFSLWMRREDDGFLRMRMILACPRWDSGWVRLSGAGSNLRLGFCR